MGLQFKANCTRGHPDGGPTSGQEQQNTCINSQPAPRVRTIKDKSNNNKNGTKTIVESGASIAVEHARAESVGLLQLRGGGGGGATGAKAGARVAGARWPDLPTRKRINAIQIHESRSLARQLSSAACWSSTRTPSGTGAKVRCCFVGGDDVDDDVAHSPSLIPFATLESQPAGRAERVRSIAAGGLASSQSRFGIGIRMQINRSPLSSLAKQICVQNDHLERAGPSKGRRS